MIENAKMITSVDVHVKVFCINTSCMNQIPEGSCCNLKRLVVDTAGKCAGFVRGKSEKPKKTKGKSNRS